MHENQILFARQPVGAQNGPLKCIMEGDELSSHNPAILRTLVRAFSRRETRCLTRRKEMSGPEVETRTILFTLPICLPATV